uniref:Homing endonuclease LAGLIDADG domain-containing protein n=1 Tax=Cantharellus appalachiensis TaxID=409893 RepID=A0A2S0S424_9AGAM|nr:hypothetical protein [Cantharellus appalachiensis]AWA82102.1 hypothetical protein [Cantharellus appalachiensis]
MKMTKLYYSSNTTSTINSKELNSILIGLLLGDAGLYRSSITSNTRLEMSFGKNYKLYAEFTGNLLSSYMTNPVKSIEIATNKRVYINYRLKTKTLPIFNHYYDMFYKLDTDYDKFIKIVPNNIEILMNPIVLAYLIMSDGNFDKGRNRVRIYTNSFKRVDVQKLANAINKNLGIYTGVLYDRKDQWILTIGSKNLDLLPPITFVTHLSPRWQMKGVWVIEEQLNLIFILLCFIELVYSGINYDPPFLK